MADVQDIIYSILNDEDREYAVYQNLYRRYHKTDDEVAKLIHRHLTDLCKKILKTLKGLNDGS